MLIVGEGDGAGGAGGSGGEVLGTGRVGGGDDGEDAAGLGGKFDIARIGEVEAVVAGGGDEDDSGLCGGVGDAIEGGFEAGAFAGAEIDRCSEGQRDDVGAVGHGVFDALDDPARAARWPDRTGTLRWMSDAVLAGRAARCMTLMLRMVAAGATPITCPVPGPSLRRRGTQSTCRGPAGPGRMPSSQGLGRPVWGLVDFGEVEGEIGGDVGMGGIDAAVENCDANPSPMVVSQGPARGRRISRRRIRR